MFCFSNERLNILYVFDIGYEYRLINMYEYINQNGPVILKILDLM